MIWHDHERMQLVMSQHKSVVVDCLHDQVRELWLAKVERTGAGLVEQVVQGGKGLSRADRGDREGPIRRQTAVKTPSDENRLFDLIEVRKPAAVEGHAK